MSETRENIWTCKIGGEIPDFPHGSGADGPMRQAVARAYREITGVDPDFTFSGWAGTLTAGERAAHEDRVPAEAEDLAEAERLEERAHILREAWS